LDRQDLPDAARKFEESLALRCENGDEAGLANSLANLARVVEIQGDRVRATRLLEESLEVRQRLGDESGISQSLTALARIARKQQDDDRALALLCQSLTIFRKLGAKRGTAECLEGLAAVAMRKGHAASAVRLIAAANHLYEDSEFRPRPHDEADRQQTIELARARLGERDFAAEWAAGRSMWPDEVIGQLLGDDPTPDECRAVGRQNPALR